MKKLFVLFTLILIVGAGCRNSTPPSASSPVDTEVPTAQMPENTTSTPEVVPATTPTSTTNTTSTKSSTTTTTTAPNKPVPTTTPKDTPKTYSMDEVREANTPEKCWTVVRGEIYDLTAWIAKHPGGDKAILQLCGTDGTEKFVNKHGGNPKQENVLAGYEIGKLK